MTWLQVYAVTMFLGGMTMFGMIGGLYVVDWLVQWSYKDLYDD